MIAEDFGKRLPEDYPWLPINPMPWASRPVGQDEFMRLKNEVEELKKLLEAAKKYDTATGQKNCEKDEKVAIVKKVAELVGVDMKDLLT